jgi:hypothetical protein
MSQNDFNLANQGFPSMRSDMNSALQALASNSSGATAPSTTYAYQFWYDTTTNILKVRNAANSAWINIFTFNLGAGTWSANAGNLTVGGSQVFYRGNILDAVSQTSGVPTGGIIERGVGSPSSRGEYVRYADGTLICTVSTAGTQDTTQATGSMFRSSVTTTWTFPAAFSTAPVVSGATGTSVRLLSIGTVTTTDVVFRHYNAVTSSDATVDTRLMAVGRWF